MTESVRILYRPVGPEKLALLVWTALELFSEVRYTQNPELGGSWNNYSTGPIDDD